MIMYLARVSLGRRRILQCLVVVAAALVAGHSRADESPPKPRWTVSGWIDTYYGFDFNRPSDHASFLPGTGTSAKRSNEFALNAAALTITGKPQPVGLNLTLVYGGAAEIVHGGEPAGTGIGAAVFRNILTASVVAKLRDALLIEAGIFPSHIGLEVFASKDNWTYTRGWMGELSPYYQAGVKLAWTIDAHWSAQLHLLNGWQIIGENNDAKAIGTQVAYTADRASVSLNGFAGPEQAGDDDHWRLFGDLIAVVKLSGALSLAATADAGVDQKAGADAAWWGAGVDGRYAVTSKLAVAGRAELYRDRDGEITGTAQTLAGGTLTLELRPVDHYIVKLEGRYDHSTAAVFTAHDLSPGGMPTFTKDEALVVLGAVADF